MLGYVKIKILHNKNVIKLLQRAKVIKLEKRASEVI